MAMGLSSVSVVLSSLWLKRFKRANVTDRGADSLRAPSKAARSAHHCMRARGVMELTHSMPPRARRLWSSIRGRGASYSVLSDVDNDADLELAPPPMHARQLQGPKFVIDSDDES